MLLDNISDKPENMFWGVEANIGTRCTVGSLTGADFVSEAHSWKGRAYKMKLRLKFGSKFEFEFSASKAVVLFVLALFC